MALSPIELGRLARRYPRKISNSEADGIYDDLFVPSERAEERRRKEKNIHGELLALTCRFYAVIQ